MRFRAGKQFLILVWVVIVSVLLLFLDVFGFF
jgi:hypothetical protein